MGTPIPKPTLGDDKLHLLEQAYLEIIKTSLQKGKGMNCLKEIEGVIILKKARHYT